MCVFVLAIFAVPVARSQVSQAAEASVHHADDGWLLVQNTTVTESWQDEGLLDLIIPTCICVCVCVCVCVCGVRACGYVHSRPTTFFLVGQWMFRTHSTDWAWAVGYSLCIELGRCSLWGVKTKTRSKNQKPTLQVRMRRVPVTRPPVPARTRTREFSFTGIRCSDMRYLALSDF